MRIFPNPHKKVARKAATKRPLIFLYLFMPLLLFFSCFVVPPTADLAVVPFSDDNCPPVPVGNCTYSIDTCSIRVTPAGGNFEFNLTVTPPPPPNTGVCSRWRAEFKVNPGQPDGWVTITSDLSGGQSSTIKYTVETNPPGAQERKGEIDIIIGSERLRHLISQSGSAPTPCTYTVDPEMLGDHIPQQGGSGSFRVETHPNETRCAWTAERGPGETWIHIDPPGSGQGNGMVSYRVDANPNSESRNGHITVQGQTHTFTQDGGAACTYSVSPDHLTDNIPAEGGDRSFNVTTMPNDSSCTWLAVPAPGETWIHILSPPNGQGSANQTVNYHVDANTDNLPRDGHISVQGQTHTFTQNGVVTPGCTYTLTPDSFSVPAQGGARTFAVTTNPPSGCGWAAVSNVPWIRTTSRGSGNGTVDYTVEPNTSTSLRTGGITVGNRVHSVSQEAGAPVPPDCYTLSPENASFPSQGGSSTFIVTVNPSLMCPPWMAVSNVPWIRTISSGSGNGTVVYTVDQNNDGGPERMGMISVGGKTFTVTQAACGFTLKPQAALVGEAIASFGFTVIADEGCKWTATPSETDLFIIKPETRSGDGKAAKTLIFTLKENDTAGKKSGDIFVGTSRFHIEQSPPGNCPAGSTSPPAAIAVNLGQVVYGVLSLDDCTFPSRSAFHRDRYTFNLSQTTMLAINLASFSEDLDPVVTLLRVMPDGTEETVKHGMDDDGAAFRNVRLPRLPAEDKAHEFMPLDPGTYIIEVTSFSPNKVGNYGLLINPLGDTTPKILGAVIDGKTLIVTGENFPEKDPALGQVAELLIGDGTKPEKNTKNDASRTRTALIALKSANKVKDDCMPIRVRNKKTGAISDPLVFPTCKAPKSQ